MTNMSSHLASLPPMVKFPEADWIIHLEAAEWKACLDSWILIASAHLSLTAEFELSSSKDESLPVFIVSFVAQVASSKESLSSTIESSKLILIRKMCFLLSHRLLELKHPPQALLRWEFLADTSKVFGKINARKLSTLVQKGHLSTLELSITPLKAQLIKELDAGVTGKLEETERNLNRINQLLFVCPEAAAFFMAGSDFLDALVAGYKLMNPSLRKAIISTLYLCIIGLTAQEKPNISSLVDQLYSLKLTAEEQQASNPSTNDTIISELVTATPVLKKINDRLKKINPESNRIDSILLSLEKFRKSEAHIKIARRPAKAKVDKGKSRATNRDIENYSENDQPQIRRISLIAQVQDLLPDLGSGFISKLLDEYGDNVEVVITNLLEGSLPSHLEILDRAAPLNTYENPNLSCETKRGQITSHLPTRHNVFDDDELDHLALDTSRLHFGRQKDSRTAETILNDRSSAPSKAAIISALAAFDSNDDERDDTYDMADIGGTVDSAGPENALEAAKLTASPESVHDDILFQAYKTDAKLFACDAATRRGEPRAKLRKQVGLTDKAIEGWAIMLSRDERLFRRLETRFGEFSGIQNNLASSTWRASDEEQSAERTDERPKSATRGFRGRRGGQRGTAKGIASGEIPGKETIIARRGKEKNKGSRANHQRKDQRARKMARGGFSG